MGEKPFSDAGADDGRPLFETFHLRHYSRVYDLVASHVTDPDRAEDICVETWFAAFKEWGRLRRQGDPAAEVERIALDLCRGG